MRGRTQIILLSKAWQKYTQHVLDSTAKIILKSAQEHHKDITRLSFTYLPVVLVVHTNARLEGSRRILQLWLYQPPVPLLPVTLPLEP